MGRNKKGNGAKSLEPTPAIKPVEIFEFEGVKYSLKIPKVNIPGVGLRTKLEVCADPEAQAYLLKNCLDTLLVKA